MGVSGWQFLKVKSDWDVRMVFQSSHLEDYVLSSTVLGRVPQSLS